MNSVIATLFYSNKRPIICSQCGDVEITNIESIPLLCSFCLQKEFTNYYNNEKEDKLINAMEKAWEKNK